jgi:hypothetical protein
LRILFDIGIKQGLVTATEDEIMLLLTCRVCHKNHSYAAEEFVGQFFVCKWCQTVNLLTPEEYAVSKTEESPPVPTAPAKTKKPKEDKSKKK